mgnify:CR=1 FL=1
MPGSMIARQLALALALAISAIAVPAMANDAPAGGVVTFASPDLYLTGGTVLLDHGHGVSSTISCTCHAST